MCSVIIEHRAVNASASKVNASKNEHASMFNVQITKSLSQSQFNSVKQATHWNNNSYIYKMFLKFIVTLGVILSVDACPSAKKANLRQEGNIYSLISVCLL